MLVPQALYSLSTLPKYDMISLQCSVNGLQMNISHKTQAVIQYIVPTAIVYLGAGAYALNGSWPSWADFRDNSPAFALISLAGMLVQDIIPKPIKEGLVFWRFADRLPGHRAFSVIGPNDPSINCAKIPNMESLKISPGAIQQQEFYKIYQSFSDSPSVSHYSQRYIAWRDLSAFLFFLAIATIPSISSMDRANSVEVSFMMSFFATSAYIASAFAAKSSAISLVRQVMLLEATKGSSDVE